MKPSDKLVTSLSCVGIKTHDECVKINSKVIKHAQFEVIVGVVQVYNETT